MTNATITRDAYSTDIMGNGLTSIICRKSRLRGCYETATGAYRHGDLRLDVRAVRALIVADLRQTDVFTAIELDDAYEALEATDTVYIKMAPSGWDSISADDEAPFIATPLPSDDIIDVNATSLLYSAAALSRKAV